MKDIRSYTPLPVCTTNMKKLPLAGMRNFLTQNNSIIKKRLANSSHIIMGMMVQAFAELQILLKSLLHKRKRRENTLLTAKDTPFVSLTGCTPIRGPWYFFQVFDCSQSSIFPRDRRDRGPTVAGSHFDF